MKPADTGPVHLYAVIEKPRPKLKLPLGTGVGDPPAPVRLVHDGVLAGVVSNTAHVAGDDDEAPARSRARALRRDMLAHSQVLNRLLPLTTLQPVRFGVILPDETAVVSDILRPGRDLLLSQIRRVDGAVEISLKVSYEEEQVLRQAVREQPHLGSRAAGGATLAERIEAGREIADAIRIRRERDRQSLLDRLAPLAADMAESTPGSDLAVLYAAFLVARDRVERFDQALDAAASDAGPAMRFNCVGPLPPYSFVDLRLDAARHSQLPRAAEDDLV